MAYEDMTYRFIPWINGLIRRREGSENKEEVEEINYIIRRLREEWASVFLSGRR